MEREKQEAEEAVERERLEGEKKKKDAAKKRLKIQRKKLLDLVEVGILIQFQKFFVVY